MTRTSAPIPFEDFLAANNIAAHRIEPLNGDRHRLVVEHNGRQMSVSFNCQVPSRFALAKLNHAIRESAP